LQPGLGGETAILINGKPKKIAPSAEGIYKLPLAKGDEAILYTGGAIPDITVSPLPADPEKINPFGGPRKVVLKPSLFSGKSVTASSTWGKSKTYAPSKAFDNNPATRWAGAHGTRSGWLEVDLGEPRTVGRVVIAELQFPSTKQFTVQCEVNGAWKEVVRGGAIGGVKKLTFPQVKTRKVRLVIVKTEGDVPTIGEFQLFAK